MARRKPSGSYEYTVYKMGWLWWAFIGIWWRACCFLLRYILAKIAGYKYLEKKIVDTRKTLEAVIHKHKWYWWVLAGWWWFPLKMAAIWLFDMLIGFKFEIYKEC